MTRVRGFAVLSLALFCAGPLVAQPDLLEQAKLRQQVEAQRVEQLVADADKNATAVGRTDPGRAVAILQAALDTLEADTSLPEAKKATLKRKVEIGLRAYQGRATDLTRPVAPPLVADPRRQPEDRDTTQIQRQMQEIRDLRAAGKTFDANRLQDDLRRRYPDNPTIALAGTIASRNQALADARQYDNQRDNAWGAIQRDIERASTPEARDYNLPSNWVELSKRRSQATQLTKTERAILEALNTPVSVDFNGEKFDEVIKYLEKVMKQPIIVPQAVLAEVQVTSDTPVKLKTDRVSMRTVLKKLLAEVGLAYVIKDQTIQVMTTRGAAETMSTRTYYVGDLVTVVDLRFGPIANQFQMIENVNRLMALVVQSVDPNSWWPNGGGRISFDPVTMSIVVRQSAEVHMMLGVGLR